MYTWPMYDPDVSPLWHVWNLTIFWRCLARNHGVIRNLSLTYYMYVKSDKFMSDGCTRSLFSFQEYIFIVQDQGRKITNAAHVGLLGNRQRSRGPQMGKKIRTWKKMKGNWRKIWKFIFLREGAAREEKMEREGEINETCSLTFSLWTDVTGCYMPGNPILQAYSHPRTRTRVSWCTWQGCI